jgi:hypothetical protein
MYDYQKDPNETVNVVDEKKYSSASKELNNTMIHFLKTQEKTK